MPWRRTRDPYAILVSEFMLQQTQVATVIDYYKRWMERFPTVIALAEASEQEVLSIWQGLGYYARARNLRRAAKAIVTDFDGHIPEDLAALEKLPGLGPYTAAAVACFAHEQRVPVIDANIARVLARIADYSEAIDTAKGRAFLQSEARALLPESGSGWLHNSALMELGARICVARKPLCESCPIRPDCRAQSPGRIPVKRPRRATELLNDDCVFFQNKKGIVLEKVKDGRWQGLWKLPSLGEPAGEREAAYSASYSVLHYRVSLRVFETESLMTNGMALFEPAELVELPMPSPHRRAVEYFTRRRGGRGETLFF